MSREDGESGTLRIGHWVTPDDDVGRHRAARPVVLPVTMAVAALLIVVSIVGGALAQRAGAPTWVAVPARSAASPPPAPTESVRPAPPSPPTYLRTALAAPRQQAAPAPWPSLSARPKCSYRPWPPRRHDRCDPRHRRLSSTPLRP